MEVFHLRERVSKVYGIIFICVFSMLTWRIIILNSANNLKIDSISFDNHYSFVSENSIQNSLMIWAKPDFSFLKENIWEMEPYVKNFKLSGNELILSLRKPFLILKDCDNFF